MTDTVLIRSSLHDITAAIPRALEAAGERFGATTILSWNRGDQELPAREIRDGVEILRFESSGSPVVSRLRFAAWVFRGLRSLRPKLVQVFDLESAVPAAVAGLLSRHEMIYDMRDPFAESFRFPPAVRHLAYAADWLAMARARAFVVPSEERIPYLGRWGRRRSVCVVRNTCHDELETLPETPLPERPSPHTVRIAYLGYLVPSRGGEWLIEVATDAPSDVQLLVAGSCRSDDMRRRIDASDGTNFLGMLDRPQALRIMQQADAVALLYDPTVPVNRVAAPNKYYEALMVGTPVLMSRGMSLAPEVEREGLGFVIKYGDTQELRRVIETLGQPAVRREYSERCRRHFLRHGRLEADLVRYRAFYEYLLS
jgi:glycosyltransferase involved in cell wall biosynthesis